MGQWLSTALPEGKRNAAQADADADADAVSERVQSKVTGPRPDGDVRGDHNPTKKAKRASEDTTRKGPARKFRGGNSVSDKDVHITEYISSDLPGFTAIIKRRYSDFHVNEIDQTNQVVELKEADLPEIEEQVTNATRLPYDSENIDRFAGILPRATIDAMVALCEPQAETPRSIVFAVSDDRDARVDLHKVLKAVFPYLYANTLNPGEEPSHTGNATEDAGSAVSVDSYRLEVSRVISGVVKQTNATRNRQPVPPFLHFTLVKENIDTNFAVSLLCRYLKCRPKDISYAGTKDKRGITTQRMCIKNMRPHRLSSLNKKLRGVALGDFEPSNNCIRLGDLNGNRFQIVLRKCAGSDSVVEKALASFSSKGFINYFGMQRFGVCSVPTHATGLQILKGNYKEAVHLLLAPNSFLDDKLDEARQVYFDTGDARRAFLMTPRKFQTERTLLGVLQDNGKNYCTALQALPKNHRMLYMHAYQSAVWNKAVSMRLRECGLDVLVGDLVYRKGSNLDSMTRKEKKEAVVFVTADNIGDFTIYDVLMPLPGDETIYPQNQVREYYEAILGEDGLSTETFPVEAL